MMKLDLPSAAALSAGDVRVVVASVGGHSVLASVLGVAPHVVGGWCRAGAPAGPAAVCLRYIQQRIPAAADAPTSGTCLLCGEGAHQEVVPQISLCNSCLHKPEDVARTLGLRLDRHINRVVVISEKPFERPLHVTFRRQDGDAGDVEIGDEQFDDSVVIDTDDYEALFDCFQVMRRRILAFYITRFTPLTINVDEVVVGHAFGYMPAHVPALATVLAWSMVHDRSPYA